LGRWTKAKIKIASDIKEAVECDLLERPTGKVEISNNTLLFDVHPFEIKTFNLRI